MILLITCPSCRKQSANPYDKVPEGALKITCNGCGNRFSLDKKKNINCKVREEGKTYDEDGWKVDEPVCTGMVYDTTGVLGLINTGLVTAASKVLPPGETQWLVAGDIVQLKDAIQKKQESIERAQRRGH